MNIFRSKKSEPLAVYDDVTDGLKTIYKKSLLPLERDFLYNEIHSPALEDPDFDAKPLVMLVGQYSTGKTSFIRYLIEKDFPGMIIGPEPTTDKFEIISYKEKDGKIPGHVMAVDSQKPYRRLQEFGGTFLSRFEGSETNSEVLKSISLVDTPGILAGEKQSISRGYDFTGVLRWFAERADRIILLFDAHKLDISDEFKTAIEAIKNQEDKIRIILNKADRMNQQQLVRVYGSLMWSLSKILNTPEVSRVYIGSFWNEPLQYDGNRDLFEREQDDLVKDLQSLPRFATVRKLNDLIKRIRSMQVHVKVIAHLRRQMPAVIGKGSKKREIIKNLDKHFKIIQAENSISAADMPDLDIMKSKLEKYDFSKFPVLTRDTERTLETVLSEDITRIMHLLPREDLALKGEQKEVAGGVFSRNTLPIGQGIMAGKGEKGWIVERERGDYDEIFNSLEQTDGKLSGPVARAELLKSKLPNAELGKIWRLADADRDGQLSMNEFALAKYLIRLKLEGNDLPSVLPDHLFPPGPPTQELEVQEEIQAEN